VKNWGELNLDEKPFSSFPQFFHETTADEKFSLRSKMRHQVPLKRRAAFAPINLSRISLIIVCLADKFIDHLVVVRGGTINRSRHTPLDALELSIGYIL
jgi:hypothetical protein